ncbi:MAG: secreted protein with Fibrobacter succinos major domain [Bacteroidetes bacterium]|nr:secreted protein with Fibrobacter succinos major domain [Bacteroidota bacterium]
MKTIRILLLMGCLIAAFQIKATEPVLVDITFGVTIPPDISVTTLKVFEIKSNQARCSFSIHGTAISERGVYYSQSPDAELTGTKSTAPGNTNNGSVIIAGLSPGTTYYVRAYARSSSDIVYGNELSFTTLNAEEKTKTTNNTGQKVEKKETNVKK